MKHMKMKKTAAFLLALAAAASMVTMPVSAIQFVGGDIDGDGSVTALDAAWVLQYAAYVGAGGTQTIYEFVPLAETEEPEKEDNTFEVEGVTGKTLTEVMNAGYDYNGYLQYGDTLKGYASSKTYPSDACKELVESLEGKTVAEMVEEYEISISYFKFGDNFTFTTNIGDIKIAFDLEHGPETLEAQTDKFFFDLEEAEEVQNDKLENVELESVNYIVEFDEASTKKILALKDISTDAIEAMSDELIVEKMTYSTKYVI